MKCGVRVAKGGPIKVRWAFVNLVWFRKQFVDRNMKSYIEEIVGKTIAGVIVTEGEREPRQQVFLVFTDDTHFELYGQYFAFGKHRYPGGMDHIIKYAKGSGAKEIHIFPATDEA
jgi:hypothetical protein